MRRRRATHKELDIVSLIDVVFLLIIFGIAIAISRRAATEPGEEPRPTMTIDVQREAMSADRPDVRRLRVRVTDSDDTRQVYAEWFPSDDSIVGLSDAVFERLPACSLISARIAYYADTAVARDPARFSDFIYLKASNDTKLRIVNYAMRQCIPYRDPLNWVKLMHE